MKIGSNHHWDINTEFWRSKCGKYSCETTGNASHRGWGLAPKYLENDWDSFYQIIEDECGDDLHRWDTRQEAVDFFFKNNNQL